MRILVVVALLMGAGPAAATPCGIPCQRCAAQFGVPKDAQGQFLFRGTKSGGGQAAWYNCLETERAGLRNKH
ncbi:hypothetical protein [Methylobacterium trifolii]|uniref:Uncharacterized protein n=1 Tax=Methylobacterium trifolii TaxID=1003092 RepID=A0ABQ4TXM8_9HYPH|nr:hypothetical protein [Methylobacterium trifolii]GJE59448.1 hypothetical protein MPOCJGCO_1541 [Methylobacterium trifolii]